MEKIKIAILGATGYTGQELLNLLLKHPQVELTAVTSRSQAGKTISEVLPRLKNIPGSNLTFTEPNMEQIIASKAQTAFLALPHGKAHRYAIPLLEAGLHIIDLSADFRLRDPLVYAHYYGHQHPAPKLLQEAIYGLPEIYKNEISQNRLIASPGCYPTSILLPLIPLLREKLIAPHPIIANSMSGVSGAGRKADISLLYAECNENVKAYGIPTHRHLSEIEQELSLAYGEKLQINFHPHLIPITRGIHTTITVPLKSSLPKIAAAYQKAYSNSPFVRLLGQSKFPEIKNVKDTNFIDIGWHHDERTQNLIITSAEDNLIKGASGQAIQAFNIHHKLPEQMGLI